MCPPYTTQQNVDCIHSPEKQRRADVLGTTGLCSAAVGSLLSSMLEHLPYAVLPPIHTHPAGKKILQHNICSLYQYLNLARQGIVAGTSPICPHCNMADLDASTRWLRSGALALFLDHNGDVNAATAALQAMHPGWDHATARRFLLYWTAAAEVQGPDYLVQQPGGPTPRLPEWVAMLCSMWVQEGHTVNGQNVPFTDMAEVRNGMVGWGGWGWRVRAAAAAPLNIAAPADAHAPTAPCYCAAGMPGAPHSEAAVPAVPHQPGAHAAARAGCGPPLPASPD